MKILIFSTLYYPYQIGGAEISTQLLAEELVKKQYTVHILTHGEEDEIEYVNGVKVIRKNFGIGSKEIFNRVYGKEQSSIIEKIIGKKKDIKKDKKMLQFYQSLFTKENYDIIIGSGNCANLGKYNFWKVANENNIPIVHIIRDPNLLFFKDARKNKFKILDILYRRMVKKGTKYIDYVVGITQYMINIHEKMGYKFKKVDIIPNAIEVNKLLNNIEYNQKENIILYVGAVSKNKGIQTLIEAFKKLDNNNYKLNIIGQKIDIEIEENERIIYFTKKNISEIYEFMSKSKILVLPSEWEEAFGRVIIEAVFNGTLAIGSNKGGIPEVFGKNNKEYIFNAGDINELTNKLNFFLQLSEDEYKQRLNKLKQDFQQYTSLQHIEKWDNYLKSIINNKNKKEVKNE